MKISNEKINNILAFESLILSLKLINFIDELII